MLRVFDWVDAPSCCRPDGIPAFSRVTVQSGEGNAGGGWKRWRPRPELNRGTRFCRPLRNHSATWPSGRLDTGAILNGQLSPTPTAESRLFAAAWQHPGGALQLSSALPIQVASFAPFSEISPCSILLPRAA